MSNLEAADGLATQLVEVMNAHPSNNLVQMMAAMLALRDVLHATMNHKYGDPPLEVIALHHCLELAMYKIGGSGAFQLEMVTVPMEGVN